MLSIKRWFHRLSFVQYPLLAAAVFYCYRPFFSGFEQVFSDINLGLVFFGLAISFATLQDTTKTHYKLAERIFSHPRWSKVIITTIGIEIIFFLLAGLAGIFTAKLPGLTEVAYGMMMLALGMIGMLKSAVEMAEYHSRKRSGVKPELEASPEAEMFEKTAINRQNI